MTLLDDIKEAICDKKLIGFDYDDYHRICEPHTAGRKNGSDAVHCFQLGGESSKGLIPSETKQDWKLMYLDKIKSLEISEERFAGSRSTPTGKHYPFDVIYKIVD